MIKVAIKSLACANLLLLCLPLSISAQAIGTKSEPRRESTPVYELLKFRPKFDTHLSDLAGDLIIVQIQEYAHEEKAKSFLKLHSGITFIGAKVNQKDGTSNYLILLGAYDDYDSARWAIEDFLEQNPGFREERIKTYRLDEIKENIVTES